MSDIDAGGASFELTLHDDLTRQVKDAVGAAVEASRMLVKAVDHEIRALGDSLKSLGSTVAGIGASIGAAGAASSFGFGKAALAAGDFAETVNMFEAVFKRQSGAVREWADNYSTQVGRSRQQLMRFLAEAQDTFVPLGFDRNEAAELSKTVTKLAVDLGSFKNIEDSDALRRLLGGIIGNTENLRAFGVVAQEAQIKAKALELGFDPKNLTAYEKALSILQITIEGTADAQGDAVKTASSLNNTIKRLKSAFQDFLVVTGEPLREIAATLIRGLAAMIEGVNEFLRRFTVLPQIAAAASVALTAIGTAATAVGAAIMFLGGSIARLGLSLFAMETLGISIGGIFQKLLTITANLRARFGTLIAVPAIKFAMKAVTATILSSLAIITRAVIAAGALVMRSLLNPWTLLATAIMAAAEAAKYYYRQKEQAAEQRGQELEQERRRIVEQSYRDAGQAVPEDLGKTLDVNNAVRVSDRPGDGGALPQSLQDLAKEIKEIKSPLEVFRERIRGAADLLSRSVISKEQFNKFAKAEMENFKRSDPDTQARQSLVDQLKTPLEKFRESVANARRLFGEDSVYFARAVKSAADQFKASDPAEIAKQQLMTPLEMFREAVANARQMFADSPEFMKRAIQAAAEQYKSTIKKAEDTPEKRAADSIREAIKTDAQKVAEKIGQAVQLVKDGLLSRDDALAYGKQLAEQFVGENPAMKEYLNLASKSASVAGQVGSFAPRFDNTGSEERKFRNKSLELQKATAEELQRIRRRKPVFI